MISFRRTAPCLLCAPLLALWPQRAVGDDRDWRLVAIAADERAVGGRESARSPPSWRAERDTYLENVRQEMKRLEADIDALVVRARNSSADIRTPLEQQIRAFRKQLAGIEAQRREGKKADQEKWREIRQAMAKSLKSLHQKIDRESV